MNLLIVTDASIILEGRLKNHSKKADWQSFATLSTIKSMNYPDWLLDLLPFWEKLPGIGPRSAERFAIDLLDWNEEELTSFARALDAFAKERSSCETCGALANPSHCPFCDERRETKTLCIVSGQKELYQIEKTGIFRGVYHVLQGLLTLEEDAIIEEEIVRLKSRITNLGVEEIIFALEGTLDGDATCHILRERLSSLNLRLSRLAFGLPIGSSFTSVDGGTLSRSLLSRQIF